MNDTKFNIIHEFKHGLLNVKIGDSNIFEMLEFRMKEDSDAMKHVVGYFRDRQLVSIKVYPGEKAIFYICSDRTIEAEFYIYKKYTLSEKKRIMKNILSNFIPEAVRVIFMLQNGMEIKPINWSNY